MDERCNNPALLTDLYELTMAQGYFHERHTAPATFSLFIRKYPLNRGFFVSCGLADVLDYLHNFYFAPADIDYLRNTKIFAADFLDFLKGLRFTGDVWAIPEGRLFFVDEPVLEVTAPIIESQLVETYIINQVNLQTLIATKAARCLHAAAGREMVDFGLRRAQGMDAGMKAARAAYVAGFAGTSNVLAGKVYGIPIVGTVANSFISSYEREIDAFRAFVRNFPERSTLLIDTYDTISGAQKAIVVGHEMEARGQRLRGVRIDSGDLLELGRAVRTMLDEAGLSYVKMVGSGGLDEHDIEKLSQGDAPYDSYGVGTCLVVSADSPWTDMAYKLVRYDGRAVLKLSAGKVTLPDEKQVYRTTAGYSMAHDTIALRGESLPGEPLLQRVMAGGKGLLPDRHLSEVRASFMKEYATLDAVHKRLTSPETYPVRISEPILAGKAEIEAGLLASEEPHVGPSCH